MHESTHHEDAAGEKPKPGHRVFVLILAVLLAMLAYGFLSGNVFETYHNGSSL